MNQQTLIAQYQYLAQPALDEDAWLDSRVGGDLWVDGLNAFQNVDRGDFEEAVTRFMETYTCDTASMTQTLAAGDQRAVFQRAGAGDQPFHGQPELLPPRSLH